MCLPAVSAAGRSQPLEDADAFEVVLCRFGYMLMADPLDVAVIETEQIYESSEG